MPIPELLLPVAPLPDVLLPATPVPAALSPTTPKSLADPKFRAWPWDPYLTHTSDPCAVPGRAAGCRAKNARADRGTPHTDIAGNRRFLAETRVTPHPDATRRCVAEDTVAARIGVPAD
jgi:hypothetical protein